MMAKLVASWLLVVVAASGQKPEANPTVELNGGMQAQILSLGRDSKSSGRPILTASVKITNKGQDHVFLLLYGEPSAVDDAGGRFDVVRAVTGVAYCPGPQTVPPSTRLCVGIPRVDDQQIFPLQGYTEIEPGKSIIVNLTLSTTLGSKGERVTLSGDLAYRLVKEADRAKDADVPATQKLKLLRFGTLSFEPVTVNEK